MINLRHRRDVECYSLTEVPPEMDYPTFAELMSRVMMNGTERYYPRAGPNYW